MSLKQLRIEKTLSAAAEDRCIKRSIVQLVLVFFHHSKLFIEPSDDEATVEAWLDMWHRRRKQGGPGRCNVGTLNLSPTMSKYVCDVQPLSKIHGLV